MCVITDPSEQGEEPQRHAHPIVPEASIGKIVADNPDLPLALIRDVRIADAEEAFGDYRFG
ncbi:MAG: hypothetical protein PHT19_17165 [Methylococcus sp.]|nr:hypothetical protein [Methylococcus sp.]